MRETVNVSLESERDDSSVCSCTLLQLEHWLAHLDFLFIQCQLG